MGTAEERQEKLRKRLVSIAKSHAIPTAVDGRPYWTIEAVLLCMLDARREAFEEMGTILKEVYSVKSAELTDGVNPGPQIGSQDSNPPIVGSNPAQE